MHACAKPHNTQMCSLIVLIIRRKILFLLAFSSLFLSFLVWDHVLAHVLKKYSRTYREDGIRTKCCICLSVEYGIKLWGVGVCRGFREKKVNKRCAFQNEQDTPNEEHRNADYLCARLYIYLYLSLSLSRSLALSLLLFLFLLYLSTFISIFFYKERYTKQSHK